MNDMKYNVRAFKKKTSIKNPAHIVVTINDNSHPSTLYSSWKGSNYELAEMLSEVRPFMLAAKKELNHVSQARNHLKSELKDYLIVTDNGIQVLWDSFTTKIEEEVRSLLINDQLGLARLSPITIQTRQRKGVSGSTPLYADGGLADSIISYVEYD